MRSISLRRLVSLPLPLGKQLTTGRSQVPFDIH
jgi:hypothetical protein